MSKKKSILEKQRRARQGKLLKAGKSANPHSAEATEDNASEPDVEPITTCVADVRQLRDRVLEQKRGHRAELRSNLAEAYRYGQDLRGGSMQAWRSFLREPFFEGRKLASPKKEHKNVFALICEYVFDAKTRANRKITFKRAAVLIYLDGMRVDPDDVPETIIELGGIEKIYKLSAAHKKAQSSKEDRATASTTSNPNAGNPRRKEASSEMMSLQNADQKCDDKVAAQTANKPAKSQLSEKFAMNKKLRERLHRIPDGQEVTLICVCLGENDQGRTRFKVRTIEVARVTKD
jgi:hypothetical protein